jgi:hypothetical protein
MGRQTALACDSARETPEINFILNPEIASIVKWQYR